MEKNKQFCDKCEKVAEMSYKEHERVGNLPQQFGWQCPKCGNRGSVGSLPDRKAETQGSLDIFTRALKGDFGSEIKDTALETMKEGARKGKIPVIPIKRPYSRSEYNELETKEHTNE